MASDPETQSADLASATSTAVRLACRSGAITGCTAGMANGYVQGNLAVFPERIADNFRLFAERNPKSCPVIGESKPGRRDIPELGLDLDIATDLPLYRVWRSGELVDELPDVRSVWRDDLVAFVIGCSFSFEEAMLEAGLPLRHVERGTHVAMYRTNIACAPAGPFAGPMVVSMRPLTPAQAIQAVQVTARYPQVHGAPVHLARPDLIGITDLQQVDYGDPVPVGPNEIPVFWACGVTPQSVIAAARPDFAITHAPGCMLVTDRLNTEFATG